MKTKQSITIPRQYRAVGNGEYQFAGSVPNKSICAFGRILVSRTVAEELEPEQITRALYQYAIGNWGVVPSAVDDLNRENIQCGGPIIACYWLGKGRIPVVFVTRENPTVTRISIW
jgi:hypothetical protein